MNKQLANILGNRRNRLLLLTSSVVISVIGLFAYFRLELSDVGYWAFLPASLALWTGTILSYVYKKRDSRESLDESDSEFHNLEPGSFEVGMFSVNNSGRYINFNETYKDLLSDYNVYAVDVLVVPVSFMQSYEFITLIYLSCLHAKVVRSLDIESTGNSRQREISEEASQAPHQLPCSL